jgi:hypothetical protein
MVVRLKQGAHPLGMKATPCKKPATCRFFGGTGWNDQQLNHTAYNWRSNSKGQIKRHTDSLEATIGETILKVKSNDLQILKV